MQIQYKHLVAIIFTIVLFLDRLDLTVVNVALPTIAKYFGISIVTTDWVNLAFLLALAIVIPISAWLGGRYGLKRVFIISLIIFGLGSSLCIWASSLQALIMLRFIQGIGGGLLIPIGMTMIYHIYDKSEYASITSFIFMPALIAPALGPFCGGILMEYFGWKSVFIFLGPISLVLVIFALKVLKEEPIKKSHPFDTIGFILSASLLIDTFYGLSIIGKQGLTNNAVASIIIAIILIKLFIHWERQITHPLIALEFFSCDLFVKANLIQLCFQVCHIGSFFLIGMYLQIGIGMTARTAGLVMGMQAVGAILSNRVSVKLFNQYGPKIPILIGLLGVGIITPCILLITSPAMISFALGVFIIRGVFSGLCGMPIQTLSVMGFEKENIGQINSIYSASRQIAISFGVAISSILIAKGLQINGLSGKGNIFPVQATSVFGMGFWVIPIFALLGILVTSSIKKLSSAES